MIRPRVTLRGMLIAVAALAVAIFAIREAATPVRPKYWVHAMIVVHDSPIRPPLGDSRATEGERELHVRQIVSDEFLRSAVPDRDPGWVRHRVLVQCGRPNQLWLHIETDAPGERLMIEAMIAAYVRSHDATVFHRPNALAPLTYPNAAPVAAATGGAAILVTVFAAWKLALQRRSRSRCGGPAA